MDKYIVWLRNDGYVSSSIGHMPVDWVTGGLYKSIIGAGVAITFQKLGEFDAWSEAYEMIQTERRKHPECDINYVS